MLEHEPTEKTKAQAQQAAGLGLPHEQIGSLLNITAKTLRKHYEVELGLGKAIASASIAKSLFNKAQGGDTTAMIWWTKAQMNWGEVNTMKLANSDGSNLEGIQVTFVNPEKKD